MCNLFVCLAPPSARHALLLLSNRDETIARPTAAAAWTDGILAGIDLADAMRGTWFGINEQGKIGLLLAITQRSDQRRDDAIPRGEIVHGFLQSDQTGAAYCDSLIPTARAHNGYTFVAIDRPTGAYEMHSFTNVLVDEFARKDWETGVHVIGNCPPHKPYAKVARGKRLLGEAIGAIEEDATPQEVAEALFTIGQDREVCLPDAQLASQTDEYDPRDIASIFVRVGSPAWHGTRSQTALVVNKDGSAFVRERRLISIGDDLAEEWNSQDFHFHLPPRT